MPRDDDECTSGSAVLETAMYGTKDAAQCFDVASESAMTGTVVVSAGVIFQSQIQARSRHGKTVSNDNVRKHTIAHKNMHNFHITLQNMTHFITWTQHINPNFPSVVFLMIHDK